MLNLDKTSLHHAYLLTGDFEKILPEFCDFLEKKLGFGTKANPDFWNRKYEVFGVLDGRELKEAQGTMAFAGGKSAPKNKTAPGPAGKKIFVLAMNGITREAQNSILKVLEEPTAGTHIFIIAPSEQIFLPTVRSRLQIIKTAQDFDFGGEESSAAKTFLAGNLAKKFAIAKKLADDYKSEKIGKAEIAKLFDSVEAILRQKTDLAKITPAQISRFEEIRKCRNYLNDKSASAKMLLEQLAIVVDKGDR